MIPFDFEYYNPNTVEEAVELFNQVKEQGRKAIYYGGGTEFISMARMHNVYADVVIDMKKVSECTVHEVKNNHLYMGSALTLTQISETNYFPLLGYVVRRIADHTIQDKITLGGNLMGTIIYKESMLPLLLSNSKLILHSSIGRRTVPILDIYNQRILLEEDELIVQTITDEKFLRLPFRHVKRTKHEKIDYPLITMASMKNGDKILIAFSGLCDYPIRPLEIENILNNSNLRKEEKIKMSLDNIPGKILNDLSGSSDFRKFVLRDLLMRILEKYEEVS